MGPDFQKIFRGLSTLSTKGSMIEAPTPAEEVWGEGLPLPS